MDPLKTVAVVAKAGSSWKLVFPELLAAFGTVFTLDVHDRACRKSRVLDKRGRKRGWKTTLWTCDFAHARSQTDTHPHILYTFMFDLYIYSSCACACVSVAAATVRPCVKASSLVQCPPLFKRPGARARYSAVVHPHTPTATHTRKYTLTHAVRPTGWERVLDACASGTLHLHRAESNPDQRKATHHTTATSNHRHLRRVSCRSFRVSQTSWQTSVYTT